jgi:hypothetical protein
MAETLKLEILVGKDLIKGTLALGGGTKDGTNSDRINKWLDNHDRVEVDPKELFPESGEINLAFGTIALAGIAKELINHKEEEK